jgi:hypothetical protein
MTVVCAIVVRSPMLRLRAVSSILPVLFFVIRGEAQRQRVFDTLMGWVQRGFHVYVREA